MQVLLALLSALGGLAALLLLLVPAGRVTIPFPDQIVLAMECANDTGIMPYFVDFKKTEHVLWQ